MGPRASVKKFAQAAFAQDSTIHSDGCGSYIPALEGYVHEHKPYDPNSGLLHWPHIVISNAKAFILGTYHGLPKSTSKLKEAISPCKVFHIIEVQRP